MVQHQLHKPKHLSLETQALGSRPHFARFASEIVNKVTTSDQRGRRSLQLGLGPRPPGPTLLHSFLFFFFLQELSGIEGEKPRAISLSGFFLPDLCQRAEGEDNGS